MRNIKAIIDADSMIYSASLSETLEGAKSNLDRAINSALNGLESEGCEISSYVVSVSYTHLTLPTNREV